MYYHGTRIPLKGRWSGSGNESGFGGTCYWVAVQELTLRYHNSKNILFTIYTCSGITWIYSK